MGNAGWVLIPNKRVPNSSDFRSRVIILHPSIFSHREIYLARDRFLSARLLRGHTEYVRIKVT